MTGTRTAGSASRRARAATGLLLVVLSALLAPLAVVTGWAHTLVSDTEAFVATYEPVVRSEAVQQVVTARLSDAVVEQVGLGDNRIVRGIVNRVVTELATSEVFAAATTASLRTAHAELVALLSGEPGRLRVTEGEVQLRLAPFAEAVKSRLSAAGVPFIDRLPEVTAGITLFRIDPQALPALQAAYRALDGLAAWLPWLALVLGLGGVVLHPRTRSALIGFGLGLVAWVAVAGLAWRLLMAGLTHRLGDDLALVAAAVAERTTAPVVSPLLALGTCGALLATLVRLAAEPVAPVGLAGAKGDARDTAISGRQKRPEMGN